MKLDNITNDQWNDLSLSCNGDTYGSYLGANVIALLVYPIGVPLALGAMLYRYKVKPLSDVNRAAWSLRVGFLTDTYKQKFWYWEVLDLGRRLLLTGIVIFIAPATIGQLCGGALFSFFFFKVHCYFRPYATIGHNFLQGAAQAVLTLCLLCGLLAQAGVSGARDDAGVGAVSLALCILFLAVLLPLSLLNELPRVQAVLRDKLEAIGVYKVEAHDGANSFKRHLPLKTPTINSAFAYTPNAAASAAAATAAANYRSNVLKTQGGAKSSSSDSTSRGGTTTDVLSSSPTWKWEGGNGTTDDNTTDTNNTISTDDNSSTKGKSVNAVRSKSSGRGAAVTDSAAAAALARAHSRAGSSSDTNNKQNNNANSSSSKQAGLTLAHFLAMADNTEIPKADAADTAGGGGHHHAADSSARSGDGITGDLMGLSANGAEMILNALRSSTDKGAEITPQVGRNGDWIFPGRGDPNGSFNSMLDSSVNDIDDSVSSVGGVSNLYPTRDHHAAGASVDGDSTIGSEVEIADWRKTVSSTAAQTAAEAARDARMRGLQLQAAAQQQQQQQQQQKYRRGYGSAIPSSADISGSGARNNSSSSIRANRSSGTARNSGTRSSRGSRTQQQQQDDTEAGFNYDTMGSFVFSNTANKHALCILQYNLNIHYSSNINNSPQSVSSYNNQRTLSHTFGTYNSNRNDSSDYDDHIDTTGRNSAGVRHNSYSRRSSARSNRSSRSGRNASATTTGSGISSSDVHLTANTTANSGANNSNPTAAAATAASTGNNASSGAQLDESASQQTYDESSALGGSQSSLMSGLGQLYPRDNMPVSPAHSNAPSSIFEAIHGASDEQAGESTDASISASYSGLNSGAQTPFDIKRHPRRPLP
eukprot:6348-Heterococcus_DN1.PRE.3